MKTLAIALFIGLYAVMILQPRYRVGAAVFTAVLFIVSGIVPLAHVIPAIDWNVLMMMTGTMILVYYFIDSRMPERIADLLLDKAPNVMMVTIYMSLFAGLISAFIDNVATVVMVAPVALAICKKLKISPVAMVLCIAVSSNLQGAATLVGDTTSIMLGAYAGMDFISFFWMQGRPGIFFAVELGALMTVPIMMFIFRNDKQKVTSTQKTKVTNYIPSFGLVGVVVCLIAASFIKDKPPVTNGLICMTMAALMMCLDYFKTRKTVSANKAVRSVDTQTLTLLLSLFLIIQGINEVGVIDDLSDFIVRTGGDDIFILYTIIVWGSVVVSAFVDNIPYVATMLPVLAGVTSRLGISPYLLYFGLLTGATLGGNLTPIGASANITAVGLLRKEGYEVSFPEFMKIGVPFTLTAVMSGYLFIWFFWKGTI